MRRQYFFYLRIVFIWLLCWGGTNKYRNIFKKIIWVVETQKKVKPIFPRFLTSLLLKLKFLIPMENFSPPPPQRPVLLTRLSLSNFPPDLNLFRCHLWPDLSIKYRYYNVLVNLWSVKLSVIFNTWTRFRQRLDTSIIFNKTNVIGLTKSSFNGCSRIEERYEETCNILKRRRLYSCFLTIMQGSDDDISHTG